MSRSPGENGLRYAPGLDGVRALAVSAVVAYHIGTTSALRLLPGGYLGVDVFFVLSGYLITSLLIVQAQQHGRISIRNFYARRARRLLPALFALLLAVAAVGAFWLPQQAARLRGDLLASLGYVQNWWLIVESSSYFANVGDRPPMLTHLWSLAVEEQYYLVWPLILIAFAALRARQSIMLVVVLAGVAASTAVGQLLYDPFADPSRVYYGTDTRALAPLVGAALAIAIRPWNHRTRLPGSTRAALDALGITALLVLTGIAATLRDTDELLYRGGFLAIALLAAAVVAVAGHPDTGLARTLATQPLRYLGERSYAIYLWHWPVCLVTRPGIDIPITGWANAGLRIAIAIALAEISYHLVEKPIRRHGFLATLRRQRGSTGPTVPQQTAAVLRTRAVGRHPVAAMLPAADQAPVTFAPVTLRSATSPTSSPPSRPLVPLLRTALLTIALLAGGTVVAIGLSAATSRPPSDVAIGLDQTPDPTPTASPRPTPDLPIGARVEFFGDSQGTSLLKEEIRPPDLGNYIEAIDATTPGCGILYGKITLGDGAREDLSACAAWPEYWTDRVTQDQPALSVIMIGAWDIFDLILADQSMPFSTDAWDRNFRTELIKAINILRAPGRGVALALTTCWRPPSDVDHWFEQVGDGRGRHLNDLMLDVADSYPSGVFIIEPPPEFCKDAAIASDLSYRVDGVHYTPKGAALYFRTVLPQILAPGQEPATPTPTLPPVTSAAGRP